MPHVQVVGECRLRDLREALGDFQTGAPPLLMRIRETFVNAPGTQLLLEAIVIEGYLRQSFFLLVRSEARGVLVRCHPASPVEKTTGVKTLIARVGAQIVARCPGTEIGHTNLAEFL
ncbi:MAG: hypothetical protein GF330_04765 [Candidatus Eisenbacteria bacterium]|nr:hypothetical protein [Candidatus Eisenbacteria bacterium]